MNDAMQQSGDSLGGTIYLAPKGFEAELEHEVRIELEAEDPQVAADVWARERLVFAPGPYRPMAWAQNAWLEPWRIPFDSIKEGARALKAIQRNWSLTSIAEHRRAALIAEALPPVKGRPLEFGETPPASPLGGWTLLDRNTIIAAPQTTSPFPQGEVHFVEDKSGPPNRAYLKLWEAFTRFGVPEPGSRCLDLGASPGGWTWVLAQLGCNVTAVDRSPLAPELMRNPLVTFRTGSAFGVDPRHVREEYGEVDWLVWDVACYPKRLLTWVRRWLDAGPECSMVCTLKFQGETDMDSVFAFKRIPGSRLVHLTHNKHELTWVRLAGGAPLP
ncbi:SAM-dependent methyltransferase [Oceanidesulfovibrio marinus]|nr:SAM-dependent methyltransferase [Oceanidesulfovibrio marinus]